MLKAVRVTEQNGKLVDFDLFWSIYPRKVAKLDALRAWEQTRKIRPGIEEMIAAVNKLALATNELQFCPHPATWLRAGRWMDE
jgi:DNA replication protein DnaC